MKNILSASSFGCLGLAVVHCNTALCNSLYLAKHLQMDNIKVNGYYLSHFVGNTLAIVIVVVLEKIKCSQTRIRKVICP